jgi:hypothetical protein
MVEATFRELTSDASQPVAAVMHAANLHLEEDIRLSTNWFQEGEELVRPLRSGVLAATRDYELHPTMPNEFERRNNLRRYYTQIIIQAK